MSLAPCACCSRHVRASESACPFCGCVREASQEREPVVMRQRSRSGVMHGVVVGAVVVTAALLGSACATYGGHPLPPPDDAGTDGH